MHSVCPLPFPSCQAHLYERIVMIALRITIARLIPLGIIFGLITVVL